MTSKEALMLLINSTKPSIWKDNFKFRNLKTNEEKTAEEIFNIIYDDLSRLEQLDSIKEELGIDLITLFNVLNDGFYFKYKDKIINSNDYVCEIRVNLRGNWGCNIISNKLAFILLSIKFKDYGKTWALTKEELEKLNNK